jgi:hypothetical protein
MKPLNFISLRGYIKRNLIGRKIKTLARQKVFTVKVSSNGLIYTPNSTGKPRPHGQKFVERFLERYNITRSLSPSNYTDISVNASYLLAIIERMTTQGKR